MYFYHTETPLFVNNKRSASVVYLVDDASPYRVLSGISSLVYFFPISVNVAIVAFETFFLLGTALVKEFPLLDTP